MESPLQARSNIETGLVAGSVGHSHFNIFGIFDTLTVNLKRHLGVVKTDGVVRARSHGPGKDCTGFAMRSGRDEFERSNTGAGNQGTDGTFPPRPAGAKARSFVVLG